MLREPKSKYVNKRSTTLLKVKTFYDAEARVVSHEPGKVRIRKLRAVTAAGGHLLTCRRPQGKYAGLVGALECVMEDGKTKFSVGSGLTDERRANPPPVRRRSLPSPLSPSIASASLSLSLLPPPPSTRPGADHALAGLQTMR